jgi:hypothetical protein
VGDVTCKVDLSLSSSSSSSSTPNLHRMKPLAKQVFPAPKSPSRVMTSGGRVTTERSAPISSMASLVGMDRATWNVSERVSSVLDSVRMESGTLDAGVLNGDRIRKETFLVKKENTPKLHETFANRKAIRILGNLGEFVLAVVIDR